MLMCHSNVAHMRSTSIRELKHDTSTVLGWVEAGETVEVRRRNRPVAVLSPPAPRKAIPRPQFAARLRAVYGRKVLPTTGTAVVGEARGET